MFVNRLYSVRFLSKITFFKRVQYKKREYSPRTNPGNCTPVLLFIWGGKSRVVASVCSVICGMINHKGLLIKGRYRGKKAVFLTVFTTFFCPPGKISGTGKQIRPETLLAGMGAGLTDPVILAFAIAAQKKTPIPTPLLTPAHGSLRSAVSRPVRFPSGGFCWAHSFFAASSRSRIEVFPWSSSRRPLLITPSIIP